MARIRTDIHWLKKITSILIIALAALLGIALPPELL